MDSDSRSDIEWWRTRCPTAVKKIRNDYYDKVIFTDASLSGYGASCNNIRLSGHWTAAERCHINILELLAIEKALYHYCKHDQGIQILLRVDSKTAICYINKFGGAHSRALLSVAKRIWHWAMSKDIWLVASYIPSAQNCIADFESRKKLEDLDWTLDEGAYNAITQVFGSPSVDLFASSLSKKVDQYVSFTPDVAAIGTDAFTISWSKDLNYCFPPFCLILRVLKKVENDKARLILVVPFWPSQVWFPTFLRLKISKILYFGPDRFLLKSPYSTSPHPLHLKLKLIAAVVCGQSSNP